MVGVNNTFGVVKGKNVGRTSVSHNCSEIHKKTLRGGRLQTSDNIKATPE